MVDINNLKIGMLVQGTIRNQTEFGSFIDIGLKMMHCYIFQTIVKKIICMLIKILMFILIK